MSRVVGPDEENLVRVVVGTKYPSRGVGGVWGRGSASPPEAGLRPCVSHRFGISVG